MKRIDRTGEVSYNKFGSKIIIINYRNSNDIDVYFPKYNWTKTDTDYGRFKRGAVSCPYEPRTYGVGYLGEGKYKASKNGKKTKCYNIWKDMIRRCYGNEKYYDKYPSYKDKIICQSWYNFQNFAEWFEENYYEIEGETMCLDKDILYKGNKIYSPKTCIFVPQRINTLFIKRELYRGDLPLGVDFDNRNCKFRATYRVNKVKKHLGYYNTKEEAFQVYKKVKEKDIKQIAEEYKDKIPTKLYNAMITYKVEIDD